MTHVNPYHHAHAVLHARTPDRAGPIRPPVVFIDGRPCPEATVSRLTARGPMDERQAMLTMPADLARTLAGRTLTIAQPISQTGDRGRWLALFVGRIEQIEQADTSPTLVTVTARDAWALALDAPLAEPIEQATFAAALAALDDRASLDLAAPGVPDAATTHTWPARTTARAVLGRLLTDHGLHVDRRLAWHAGHVSELRALRSDGRGRPLTFAAGQRARRGPEPRPIRWTAVGRGAVVESTFDLLPGWPGEAQGLTDAEYGRSTSSDFDAVANVYRRWVLNEDGGLPGPRYDATALFADGRATPAVPLRLGPALSTDPAGRSMGVVVDVSTDAQHWSRYPGVVLVLADRAGVRFDDDALPPALLAAAKAGTLAVRVTATLRNPLPMTDVRWAGNPFAGPFEERRVDLADRFAHRRVDATSKYAASIAAGARGADQVDERGDLAAWLARHAVAAPDERRAALELPRLMPGLRIGDRCFEPDTQRALGIDRITHDWRGARTVLELRALAEAMP